MGIAASLPLRFGFLAIEQLPLAAEEAHDPQRDMPGAYSGAPHTGDHSLPHALLNAVYHSVPMLSVKPMNPYSWHSGPSLAMGRTKVSR